LRSCRFGWLERTPSRGNSGSGGDRYPCRGASASGWNGRAPDARSPRDRFVARVAPGRRYRRVTADLTGLAPETRHYRKRAVPSLVKPRRSVGANLAAAGGIASRLRSPGRVMGRRHSTPSVRRSGRSAILRREYPTCIFAMHRAPSSDPEVTLVLGHTDRR
jgi:hypothetical protein